MYYEPTLPNDQPINRKYPSVEVELDKIWRGTFEGVSFSQKFVKFGIHGDRTSAKMLYTKISKEDFISHFVDSMEYCVYPEIPNNTKHWIVKLEDNWYLYDVNSYFELE